MKRFSAALSVLILLTLSACELPLRGAEAPTAIPSETATQVAPVEVPLDTVAPGPPPTFTPTSPPPEAPPAAPPPALPSPTLEPPQPAVIPPTATLPAPTATAPPAITFDPLTALGEPDYENPMRIPNYSEWVPAGEDNLPNNRYLRLRFKDGELYVTGKRPEFSTWFFTYHTLSDAYIEMTFNSEDCSGEDTYGIIFRGAPHKAGISYGYVASFTCDGQLWLFRLDDADPWKVEDLVEFAEFSAINAGPEDENVIGVRAEGEQLVIYANGVQVAAVEDDHFEKGRVGVFVRSGGPESYTFRVTNFAYWLLGEED